jgi:YVTN family beta-propeller protein
MTRLTWLLAAALATACNSSTTPRLKSPSSGCTACTHPAGVIYHTDNVGTRVYAAAATDGGTVMVSLEDNAQIARVVLPYVDTVTVDQVGTTPADIALDASQTHAYVSDEWADQIIELDVASGTHLATIATIGDPFVSVPSSDGATLYIGTNTNSVYAVPLSNPTTSKSIQVDNAVGGAPNFMALSPDGSTLYVSTRTGGTVVVIDTRTFTATRTLSVGAGRMQQIVVSPDGKTIYVVNENGNLYVWDNQSGSLITTVPLGGQAWALAMTPDAKQLYVSLLDRGMVLVLDRATLSTVTTILTGGEPRRIAFAEQGKIAVIANEGGYFSFID